MAPSHIFIVGVGRSGTKFLMNVLNNHSQINIAPETHCFSTLLHHGLKKVIRKVGDLNQDSNLEILVHKMVNEEIFGTFWKPPFPLKQEKLLERFKTSSRKLQDIFTILIDEHRILHNKLIAGEKTPSHLYHVDTLFEWFPNAKVIHIIRDPRDILASEINKNLKPDYPLQKGSFFYNWGLFMYVLIQWNLAIRLNRKYLQKYPRNYTSIRYEDLLLNHEQTVREVCNFLNVDFEEAMLHPPVVDSSFQNHKEHGTRKNSVPTIMIHLLEFSLRSKMKSFGYL